MNACPSQDIFRRYLEDALPPTDEVSVGQHLETCSECIKTLERLTSEWFEQPCATLSKEILFDAACVRLEMLGSHCETLENAPQNFEQDSSSSSFFRELRALRRFVPKLSLPSTYPGVDTDSRTPQIPGYEIQGELGRGGMGIVYRARQLQLNRPVALKMILQSSFATQEQVVRFLAEAQMCAALRHPGIVQIYEVSEHQGIPFFSMELLENGTLGDLIKRQSISPQEAAAVVEDLARAIHSAHLQGVIHRDLKPANILLQPCPTRTRASCFAPKITDFGLARRFDRDTALTQTGALIGTPDYMAPEQIEPGKHIVGPAVDIYSLGAILYCLLTGRPPFTAPTFLETLALAKTQEAQPPSQINRNIPHDLSIICLHCLHKIPGQRYETAELLANDLRRFLAGEPIAARPISEWERLRKWSKRNPGITALTSALLSTILIALILVSWQWKEAVAAKANETIRANSESLAKKAEIETNRKLQVLSANLAMDRGILSCRAGKYRVGLTSLLHALELLPSGESELEFAIRANINGWLQQTSVVEYNAAYGTAVTSVAYSPDGQRALVGDWGNSMGHVRPAQAILWDTNHWSGQPIWTVEHPAAVWSVAFSPDGQRIALGGFDGTAIIRDASTGKQLSPPLPHAGRVYAVAFSPDGKLLATAGHVGSIHNVGASGELKFWDAVTGTPVGETKQIAFRIHCMAWHPSSKAVAIGGMNVNRNGYGNAGEVALWDIESDAILSSSLLHPDTVTAIAFAPNKQQLVTGCRDGLVRFWELDTQKVEQGRFYSLHQTRTINSLSFSRDGKLLAVASGHHEPGEKVGIGEVVIWNMLTRSRVVELPFEKISGHSQKMHSVAFGDNDRRLAAVNEHGRAWQWTTPPFIKPVQEWNFPRRCRIQHSHDGKKLLLNVQPLSELGFGLKPCEFHLIDALDGHTIATLPHKTMSYARFSPDDKMFVTFANKSEKITEGIWLWDANTGMPIQRPDEFPLFIKFIRFTPDNNSLQTISENGLLQHWEKSSDSNPFSAKGPATIICQPDETCLSINASSTRALINGPSGTRLIHFPSGANIASLSLEQASIGGFVESNIVFATSENASVPVRCWNSIDGSPLEKPVDPRHRWVTAWHPHAYSTVVDLAPERGEKGSENLAPSLDRQKTAIHPFDRYYVSGEKGVAHEAHFWSFLGKPLGPPIPHGRLYDLEFNPNGKSLVTASEDGSVKQWSIPWEATETLEQQRDRILNLPEL